MASKIFKRTKKPAKANIGPLNSETVFEVFNTYELLERILLCLAAPDLRQARFVSKRLERNPYSITAIECRMAVLREEELLETSRVYVLWRSQQW